MPSGLSPMAQQHWQSVVPQLVEMGVAKEIDTEALATMCESWSRYRDLHRYYRKGGVEDRIRLVTKVAQAEKQWFQMAGAFGMTPSDRARLTVDKDEIADSFDELLA